MRPQRTAALLILLTAAAVRLWGLGFGLPLGEARPDETAIAGAAVSILSGDLQPGTYYYPALQKYTLAAVYAGYYWVTKPWSGHATLAAFADSRRESLAPFFYLSRGVSALMGVLTVWWVFAIGRRLFDPDVGLVGALFLALSFLHVRDSHFGVTDVAMTALVVLTVLAILRWRESGRVRDAALAGLAGGLATSTKYNGLGVGVPFAVAAAQRFLDARRPRGRAVPGLARAAATFGLALALAFLATSPYTLLDWTRFVHDVTEQGAILAQGHGLAFSRGWLHHARVTLPAALGWPVYAAGVVGAGWLLATRPRQSAVLLAFPIAYYAVAGSGYTVFARYMIPVLPFLSLTAAWLVVLAVRAAVPAGRTVARGVAIAAVSLAFVTPSAASVVALDRLLARTDNRVIVSRALGEVIPAGASLYLSDRRYGRAPLELDGQRLDVVLRDYDDATGFGAELPEWILLQRSPLTLYSTVPEGVERLVKDRYSLARAFVAADARPDRVYDQQDAFFLPLEGFEGIERPGPNFELYRLEKP